jgi:hypothetical protein
MNKNELLTLLFKDKFLVANEDEVFHGIGELGSEKVFILGTENNTYIAYKSVLFLTINILDIVKK